MNLPYSVPTNDRRDRRDRMESYYCQKVLGVVLNWIYLANIFWILSPIFCSYNLERANCDFYLRRCIDLCIIQYNLQSFQVSIFDEGKQIRGF